MFVCLLTIQYTSIEIVYLQLHTQTYSCIHKHCDCLLTITYTNILVFTYNIGDLQYWGYTDIVLVNNSEYTVFFLPLTRSNLRVEGQLTGGVNPEGLSSRGSMK